MRQFFVALLALALALPTQAQSGRVQLLLNALYDLDATDPTYCTFTGVNNAPRGGDIARNVLVTTSGSSATIAAVSSSTTEPFVGIVEGDLIVLPQTYSATSTLTTQGRNERVVTAKASNDSITASSAIELPLVGTNFSYRKQVCGTAATDGWIPVQNLKDVTFTVAINQLSVGSGGVAVTVECRNLSVSTGVNTIFAPTAYTTVGTRSFIIVEPWDECRVGYELSGADDGSDTGADAEQITVQMRARVEN